MVIKTKTIGNNIYSLIRQKGVYKIREIPKSITGNGRTIIEFEGFDDAMEYFMEAL